MSNWADLVYRLNKKVDYVLQHAASLKEQMEDQKVEIESLKAQLLEKENQCVQLSEKVELLETAGALSGANEDGKREARLKINELVREIDKCIALLNK